jgi:signal transduction histidine kinase
VGIERRAALGAAAAVTTAVVILVILAAPGALPEGLAPHVAFETTASLVSLLAGLLVFARLQRNSRLSDVTLVVALAIITLSNVLFVLVPMVTEPATPNTVRWAALIGRVVGGALFAAAAFISRVRLPHAGRAQTQAALGALAALLLIGLVTHLLGPSLPQMVTPASGPHARHGEPVVSVLESVAAVIAGTAAIGYLRRSQQVRDEFSGWLGIAAVFTVASNLSYATHAGNYPAQGSRGDLFRFCFYIVLLAGSMREIRSYWHELTSVRVAEERQRIARDLHDGLSQELAYLTRNISGLRGAADDTTVRQLRFSVDRARLAARVAIHRVAAAPQRPVSDMLSEAAIEVARHLDLDLDLDLDPDLGIGIAAARANALVGIACEALTNAAWHSGSRQVSLILRRDGHRVRMRVRDSGHGFNIAACKAGFGLISMRDRARSVGGEVSISSEPGGGSQVEATV